jgi:hypothetical protein
MRLWSIHPEYLDSRGLVALWREALLAQKVLQGKTRGYRNHPQLIRFQQTSNPVGAIASYLRIIVTEATRRGYCFDRSKIVRHYFRGAIPVSDGQLKYELNHLLQKLKTRDPDRYNALAQVKSIKLHPSFYRVRGGIADWEVR